ncbi:PqqD family protein [Paenibacillus lutrae]|uniref:PqqD family peptide modification chaperone n=1 Tax=Paenibacillus lutrae TaxID=2078573 RepID=A0A7X3FFF2_9BACL|nr:PqqD family protein [Paenibacillus lutrae]MVO98677.1 PqqD family peptide modification chaperone [Paenibacillus lutrae]
MNTKFRRHQDTEVMLLDGEYVIMHMNRQSITKVNEIGGIIWSLLTEAKTVHELVLCMQEQYETTYETAEHDIRLFLQQLGEYELVEVTEAVEQEPTGLPYRTAYS